MRKITLFIVAALMIVSAPQIRGQEREKTEAERQEEKEKAMQESQAAERARSAHLEEAYLKSMRELELRQMHIEKEMMEEHAAALMAEFSEQNEQESLTFLREEVPWYHDELVELKQSNPKVYRKKVMEAMRRKWSLSSRAGGDKALYEELVQSYALHLETGRLTGQYRSADAGRRPAIRSQLRDALGRLFELRERDREREMMQLEQRLTSLQENLKLRKQNKDLIVDNRLKQLLGEASNLDW